MLSDRALPRVLSEVSQKQVVTSTEHNWGHLSILSIKSCQQTMYQNLSRSGERNRLIIAKNMHLNSHQDNPCDVPKYVD